MLDFAGGIVVHNIAGMAALASVLFVGRRRVADPGPHSIPLVALGTGLLWFGWYGFNAGSELQVDAITGAGLPQHRRRRVASPRSPGWSSSGSRKRKPKFVGLLTGAVAGLATITPAAGFVTPWARGDHRHHRRRGLLLGRRAEEQLGWDDALDVWGVHGVGGALGMIMLGVLGSKPVNPAGADGLLYGGGDVLLDAGAARSSASSVYAFVFTWGMLWLIDKVTPVRTTEEEEGTLDESLHGEPAYEV